MAAKYIHNIYPMMHLGGLDLPGDLPKSALTTILHIKPGKYEPSYLKFVIVICWVFWGVSRGVTYDMTVQC